MSWHALRLMKPGEVSLSKQSIPTKMRSPSPSEKGGHSPVSIPAKMVVRLPFLSLSQTTLPTLLMYLSSTRINYSFTN